VACGAGEDRRITKKITEGLLMVNENSAAMKAAEKQTEPTKPKRTNEEKLQELYAKRDKLLKRQAAVKTQEKSLDKRITALKEKIKEIERTRLLNMCKERNWTLSDLMDVLESIPEGMNFKTFTKKVNKKSQQTKKEKHDDQI
jgi:molecular chaperone DnaK (HSP70)